MGPVTIPHCELTHTRAALVDGVRLTRRLSFNKHFCATSPTRCARHWGVLWGVCPVPAPLKRRSPHRRARGGGPARGDGPGNYVRELYSQIRSFCLTMYFEYKCLASPICSSYSFTIHSYPFRFAWFSTSALPPRRVILVRAKQNKTPLVVGGPSWRRWQTVWASTL